MRSARMTARRVADPKFAQQCFVTAEPLAAKRKGGDPQVFLVADEGFNPYAGVVIVKKGLLTEHPDWVKSFVEASREGWGAYLADPKPANDVMHKLNATMDDETFAGAAAAEKVLTESDDTKARGFGAMSKSRWETFAKQLVELGVIEKAPSIDSYPE